jgi:GNAT superfamily N-acetyltransferase
MIQVTLQSASAEHADAVATVLTDSRKAFLPYAPFAHSEASVRRWVREALLPAGGVTRALVGVPAVEVVGVLAVSRGEGGNGNEDGAGDGGWWIDQLYVAPPYVNQGIGGVLLRHALATLQPPLFLYTFQQNTLSRRFYERAGFEAVELTDGAHNEERCPDVKYVLRARPALRQAD